MNYANFQQINKNSYKINCKAIANCSANKIKNLYKKNMINNFPFLQEKRIKMNFVYEESARSYQTIFLYVFMIYCEYLSPKETLFINTYTKTVSADSHNLNPLKLGLN